MLDVIEEQAEQGVDYMTIHAGVLVQHIPLTTRRITALSAAAALSWPSGWSRTTGRTCSTSASKNLNLQKVRRDLFAGRRIASGSVADASDEAQFAELKTLGELTRKAGNTTCR